jgi:DNA mismatch endonuclease (patch repair protein)
MADTRTTDQRRRIMQAVGARHTGPELLIRRLLHGLGYRFRLHRKDLPGRPDVVFSAKHKVVLIHGCFWHGHGCAKGKLPKSREEYWRPKIEANIARDARVVAELNGLGWRALTIWQCELKLEQTEHKLREFLGPPKGK